MFWKSTGLSICLLHELHVGLEEKCCFHFTEQLFIFGRSRRLSQNYGRVQLKYMAPQPRRLYSSLSHPWAPQVLQVSYTTNLQLPSSEHNTLLSDLLRSHDSVVRIETRLRVQQLRNQGLTLRKDKELFSSPNHANQLWGPSNSYLVGIGGAGLPVL